MSDTNDAIQQLKASVETLKKAVNTSSGGQTAEIAVLFTVVSLLLGELPQDRRDTVEDSFSDWANGLSDPALATSLKQVARRRLGMNLES